MYGNEAITGKSDVFFVDPRAVVVVPGKNVRNDFGDLESLMQDIVENGVQNPIHVKKNKDGAIELEHGERRLRAILMALDNGHDVKLPAIMKPAAKMTDIQSMFLNLSANSGKPFTPSEEGEAYRRLVAWGLTVAEIERRTGKTNYYVKSRLALADSHPDLKRAVDSGKVAIKDAVKVVKDSAGSIEEQKVKVKEIQDKAKEPKPVPVCDMAEARKAFERQASRFYREYDTAQSGEPAAMSPKAYLAHLKEQDEEVCAMLYKVQDFCNALREEMNRVGGGAQKKAS